MLWAIAPLRRAGAARAGRVPEEWWQEGRGSTDRREHAGHAGGWRCSAVVCLHSQGTQAAWESVDAQMWRWGHAAYAEVLVLPVVQVHLQGQARARKEEGCRGMYAEEPVLHVRQTDLQGWG